MNLLDYHCFSELTQEQQRHINLHAKKVIIPSDTILYYQGDVCEEVLFLQSGSVEVFIQPQDVSHDSLTLYELHPGSQCVANLLSTITTQAALANARTITPIEGWLLPRSEIMWLIENSSSFREFKAQEFGKRLSALVALLGDVKFSSIEQRLLNWIYVQGLETIQTTHAKIAEAIGVTRETVSRNLKKLERQGYIKLGRGCICTM